MVRIFNTSHTDLRNLFFPNWLSAAAGSGAVDWTKLIAADFHEEPPGDSIGSAI